MSGDSLLLRWEMTSIECYKGLFLYGVAPQFFHQTLRRQRLFTAGFRHRLILNTLNKMMGCTAETTLREMALP